MTTQPLVTFPYPTERAFLWVYACPATPCGRPYMWASTSCCGATAWRTLAVGGRTLGATGLPQYELIPCRPCHPFTLHFYHCLRLVWFTSSVHNHLVIVVIFVAFFGFPMAITMSKKDCLYHTVTVWALSTWRELLFRRTTDILEWMEGLIRLTSDW